LIRRAQLPLQAYAWQTLAIVAAALALGFATASDPHAAAGLFGSAAAGLALGVSFTYRRFGTLIATWLFFLLQPLLVAVVGKGSAVGHVVNVIDIPILLIIGLLGLLYAARHHATAVRWLSIAGGVVLVCGFASDLAAGAPLTPSIIGAALRMKLFLVLGAGLAVPWTPALATKARKVVLFAAVIVALTGIFDFVSGGALRDVFADPHTLRLGYVSAGGIFQNLAELHIFMAIAFTALLGMAWQDKAARRVPQLLLVVLAALSTLRLTAIVSIPAAALALAVASRRVRLRLVLLTALGALSVGALITLTHRNPVTEVVNLQVGKYTSETQQARQLLQTVSIEIARDNFPLGAGFGRFASGPSVEKDTYSPIYREYGLARHYGFGPNDPIRVAFDASWPGLLGEVGVVGCLAFAATILVLTRLLFGRSREDGVQADFASIGFGVMVVILIESVGGAAMFQSFTMLTGALFIVPGLWLVSGREPVMR
jgi:hypothetical protein